MPRSMYLLRQSQLVPLLVSNSRDVFNGNVGDAATNLALYFPWLADAPRVQLDRLGIIPDPRLAIRGAIVGGGGMINSLKPFEWGMQRVIKSAARSRLVLWGAGLNTHHGGSEVRLPSYIEAFGLVGLRDWLPKGTSRYRWVPCPSVMLPELMQPYEITQEVVVYDNWQFKSGIQGPPKMNNGYRFRSAAAKRLRIKEVIAFLGSAETVITSTYHGALWATLLGRKVLIVNPFSSKFYHLRHQPEACTPQNWQATLPRAQSFPGVLDDYRQVTQDFAAEVRARFGI